MARMESTHKIPEREKSTTEVEKSEYLESALRPIDEDQIRLYLKRAKPARIEEDLTIYEWDLSPILQQIPSVEEYEKKLIEEEEAKIKKQEEAEELRSPSTTEDGVFARRPYDYKKLADLLDEYKDAIFTLKVNSELLEGTEIVSEEAPVKAVSMEHFKTSLELLEEIIWSASHRTSSDIFKGWMDCGVCPWQPTDHLGYLPRKCLRCTRRTTITIRRGNYYMPPPISTSNGQGDLKEATVNNRKIIMPNNVVQLTENKFVMENVYGKIWCTSTSLEQRSYHHEMMNTEDEANIRQMLMEIIENIENNDTNHEVVSDFNNKKDSMLKSEQNTETTEAIVLSILHDILENISNSVSDLRDMEGLVNITSPISEDFKNSTIQQAIDKNSQEEEIFEDAVECEESNKKIDEVLTSPKRTVDEMIQTGQNEYTIEIFEPIVVKNDERCAERCKNKLCYSKNKISTGTNTNNNAESVVRKLSDITVEQSNNIIISQSKDDIFVEAIECEGSKVEVTKHEEIKEIQTSLTRMDDKNVQIDPDQNKAQSLRKRIVKKRRTSTERRYQQCYSDGIYDTDDNMRIYIQSRTQTITITSVNRMRVMHNNCSCSYNKK